MNSSTRRTIAAAALVAAPVLATIYPATSANADPVDPSFLTALTSSGVGFGDPSMTTQLGKSVCPMLVEPGKSFASVAQTIRGGNNGGISPEMASFFTGIAISMYCPQMISSISDGSVLNQVSGLQGIGALAGLNGFGGLGGLTGLMSGAG